MSERRAQEVLEFWFGDNPLSPDRLSQRMRLWFGEEEPGELRELRDRSIAVKFGALVRSAAAGELDVWSASPHRLVALVLLLDQFPRQIYRRTPLAFAQDGKALALVQAALQTAADAMLNPAERLFLYMPLQHSEDPQVQEQSVTAFARLAEDAPADLREHFQRALHAARAHRDLIDRFGRFPHRNVILGRQSSAAERAYLHQEGARFGQ